MDKGVEPVAQATESGKTSKRLTPKRRNGIFLLEPRVMYDGAAAPTAAAATHHHDHAHNPDDPQGGPVDHHHGNSQSGASAGSEPTASFSAPTSVTQSGEGNGRAPGGNVVFVDSQIAAYQAIVSAITPGTKVFVFDGTQDGLQQIAQDLQGMHGLHSVDIISHGAADEVLIGTDTLTTSTIPTYAADLTAIGKALAPHGQLDLYGCDVAAAGDGFLEALRQATGRNVAASTGPVGATALGGTWTLDATTGPTPDALPANLAALQSFDGLLLTTPSQIFFDTWNGEDGGVQGQGNMVEQLTANGSTLVSSNTVINDGSAVNPNGPNSGPYPALTSTTGFVVDTALNEYFIASYNALTYTWTIQEGKISGGGLTTLYTDPFPSLTSNNAPGGGPITGTAVTLGGLALDAKTGELYFAQDAENYQTGDYVAADTGIYKINIAGGAATLVTSTTAGLSNPAYLTLDTADNLVFFDDSIVAAGGFPAVNNLDVANLTTGAVTVLTSFTSSDPYFGLQGMDIDTANHTLYLATADLSAAGSANSGNAILSYNLSVSGSGSTATASVGAATTLYSGSGAFQPTDIVVDAGAGIFYTTGSAAYTSSVDGSGSDAAVFEGSLSGGSALTEVFAVSTVLPAPTLATGDAAMFTHAPQLFLADLAPVVTAGATVTFDGGGSAVTLDPGLAIAAGSSTTLASATVTLTSGELSSDILSFNSGTNTETFSDGDHITATYSAGVLTLSGTASVADYQAALDQAQFSTTSNADPTNGGGDTSRTISWTVNDGTSSSAASTSTLDTVHAAPTVTAGASVTVVSGGSAAVLDGGLSVADVDSGGDLTGATVKIGTGFVTGDDTLSFTNQAGITGTYNSGNGTLTLSGTATLAQYQAALESIKFSTISTSAGGRTIDWSVKDAASSSSQVTSTVSVEAGPILTAGATTTFTGGSTTPVALDAGLTISDPDGATDLTGATVTISNGLISGDTLNFSTQNGISGVYSSGVLTLTGNATIGQYQTALESVTYSFSPTSGDPTNGGVDTARTITWKASDALATSAAATSTLAIDVAPTVVAGASQNYVGGGSAVVLDSGITLTDSLGSLSGATVTIGGFIAGDTLNFTTQNGITGVYSNGVLTLSGTATTAQYQAALASVTYSDGNNDPTGGGGHTSRTISWQVIDTESLTSSISTSSLSTQHVAPTVTAGATATFTGGGSPVALDSTLTVSDVDSGGNLTGASVQIVGFVNGEVLNFTTQNGISEASYANGVLTLTGTATVGQYQTALRSVTFSFNPANADPTLGNTNTQQSIDWVVNDGNTVNGTNETPPSAQAINNDQPTLGLNQLVVENGIFPSQDGGGTGGIPLGSIRTFAGSDPFTGAQPANGQVLSINANQALFSILGTTYGGNGQTDFGLPNLGGTLGVGSSSNFLLGDRFGTDQFTLTAQNLPHGLGGSGLPFDNDQPSLTVNYIINVGGVFSGNSTNALGEVVPFLGNFAPSGYMFASGQLLSIQQNTALFSLLGTTYGGNGTTTFALPDLNGKTIVGAGSDAFQTVLAGTTTGQDATSIATSNLPFPTGSELPVSNDQPSVALTYLVSTSGLFPNNSNLTPDTPYLGEIIAYAGAGLNNMLQAGWAVANGQTLSIAQNSALFSVLGTTYGGDGTTTFNLPDLVGRSIAGVGTNADGTTVSLGETYGTDSFTLRSNNIPLPVVATSTLDLVHAPPTVTAGTTATFDGGGSPVQIDPSLTVRAPDSSDMLTGATVQITGGFKAGDTLNFTNQSGITEASFTNGELTLTGNATAEQYQSALESITYSFNPANSDPTSGNTDTTRTITYVVDDGVESSAAVTSTLHTVHVTPSITAGASTTFAFGGSPVALDSALTVSDPDSGDMLTGATVKVDNGFLLGDSLNFTTQNGITGSYNSGAGVLTLTGSATVEQYQTALDSITFSTTNQTDTSHTIDWTVSDQVATSAVSTSMVTVAVGPILTAGLTVNGTEGASTGTVTVATFTDPLIANATASDFTATVNWGDGSQTSGTVIAQNGGGFAVTGAHTYAEEGSYTIGVAVADTNNVTGNANDSATIADAPLTAGAATVSGGVEGVTAATLSATFTDANTGATASDFSGTIAWGDGTTTTFTNAAVAGSNGNFIVSGSHLYAEEGAYRPTVTINDVGGSTTTDSGTTTVADAPLTAAGTTLSSTEGVALAATVATFTDANPNAPLSDFTATINWGDGTNSSGTVTENAGVFSVAGTHTYAEEGSYTSVVTINDVGGSTAQATSTATIADAPLTAGATTVTGGVEGVTAATLSATFTDANTGATASDFSGTIAWGDGTTTNFLSSNVTANGNGTFTVSGSHLYAEEGTDPVSIVIKDVGGSTTTETGTATVADAPLKAGTSTVSGGVEGVTPATLAATFSDANTGAPTSDFSGTIVWGDGTSTAFTSSNVTANGNGSFTVSGSHLYAEEGTYTSTMTINDVGGSAATETGTTTVADAPLTAGIATVSGGVEGVTPATLAATFSDANTGAPTTDFSGTIVWGDGTSTAFNSSNVTANGNGSFTVSGSHLYAEEGAYTSLVTINDAGGSTTTETGTTTVADAPLTAGTATITGGVEGVTPATLSATFSDANTGAPTSDFSGVIAWGDGTTTNFTSSNVTANGNGTFTVSGLSHVYAEEGTDPISVTIKDAGGSTTTETGTTTVADAPLTAGTATVTGGVEGVTAAKLSATFSDANTGAPTSDFSGVIAWGDGTTTNFLSSNVTANGNGTFTVSGLSHVYAEEGTDPISVTIKDAGGSTTTDTGTTTVADAPLTAAGATLSGTEGAALAATVATFTDANPNAPLSDLTATINWGDGTNSSGTVTENAGVFSVAGTHAYVKDGQYTSVVTINDVGGSTAQATSTVEVAPTLSAGGAVIYVQNGSPIQLDATATADLNGGPLAGATVSIGSGLNTGDVLTFTNQNGITGSYDAVHGVLTLTGSASVANYNAALDSITFSSTSSNPSNDGADPARTIVWSVKNGNPSNAVSATVTSTVDVEAVPTVVAGADVSLQALGTNSVVLDPAINAFDDTPLTGATVTIAGGFQSSDVLAANTANTAITASYANGVLTLTGVDTAQHYQAVLASVTLTSSQTQSGPATIDWQITDHKGHSSAVASSTAEITGNLVPPPVNTVANPLPATTTSTPVADFSGLVTNAVATAGEVQTVGQAFNPTVHVIHSDVTASIGPDGAVAFNLPLIPLEAALGGDVVSVTASLADGQPLPAWLHFDTQNGQFAGLLPDESNVATGSIEPDAAIPGQPRDPNVPAIVPQSITIEVLARDSKGNMSITEFTIDLSAPTPHKGDKHGWNVLPDNGAVDSASGPHRDIALWHGAPAFNADRVQSDHTNDRAPIGRAGFSDQIKNHGWHAAAAQRMALLDSLQQAGRR